MRTKRTLPLGDNGAQTHKHNTHHVICDLCMQVRTPNVCVGGGYSRNALLCIFYIIYVVNCLDIYQTDSIYYY